MTSLSWEVKSKMSWEELEKAADDLLDEILRAKSVSPCKCGRVLDRGDVAWNNGCTEYGTPYSIIEIICQQCDEEAGRVSCWAEMDTLLDVAEELRDEWS